MHHLLVCWKIIIITLTTAGLALNDSTHPQHPCDTFIPSLLIPLALVPLNIEP